MLLVQTHVLACCACSYDEVKALMSSGESKMTFPLHKKILAGGISGGIGAAIATPTGA